VIDSGSFESFSAPAEALFDLIQSIEECLGGASVLSSLLVLDELLVLLDVD
jgi:hypothetical protein